MMIFHKDQILILPYFQVQLNLEATKQIKILFAREVRIVAQSGSKNIPLGNTLCTVFVVDFKCWMLGFHCNQLCRRLSF